MTISSASDILVTSSVLDIFTIGVGPSSSHTVGPMRAALLFAQKLAAIGLEKVGAIRVELFGSLGLTGQAHGTDKAIICGLTGDTPEIINPAEMEQHVTTVRARKQLLVLGDRPICFDDTENLIFHRDQSLPLHSNGMRFTAQDASGRELLARDYYSVGGGVVMPDEPQGTAANPRVDLPYPFSCANDILRHCRRHGIPISRLILENEKARRSETSVRQQLAQVWAVMQRCVQRGCSHEGVLPGGLSIQRRAPLLLQYLTEHPERTMRDPLSILDWVCLYALAVSEENAAGGQVVTAPTNGAAGIIPAVLHYYTRFCPMATEEGIVRFLLTAGAIGMLCRQNASVAASEVGCQGEVGVACSMAAAGLTEVLGGTAEQAENAAEIAMEHNLGLTCDPVRGLVQIPCIERNAMGAIKALGASRLALQGDGRHRISLDAVIATMRQTGADMSSKYKETSLGGLAVNSIHC